MHLSKTLCSFSSMAMVFLRDFFAWVGVGVGTSAGVDWCLAFGTGWHQRGVFGDGSGWRRLRAQPS